MSSTRKRIRNADDDNTNTLACVAEVFQNYALIHVHVMRFLPLLADRACLASTTRNLRHYCMKHDTVLKQMWTTWAVPNLPRNVRSSLLLPSGLMTCIQWAWNHEDDPGNKSEHYSIILSKLGHVEGVMFAIERVADELHRRQLLIQCVMQMFHSEKSDSALQLYEKHVVLMKPSASEIRLCIMSALYTCSPVVETRIMSWKPDLRPVELRLLGLMMALHCQKSSVMEYHFKAIANIKDAMRALACVVNSERVHGADYLAMVAKCKVRTDAVNMSHEEFWVHWLDGMNSSPETFEFKYQ